MIYHVFANKSNIGDWLSARGIQSLLAPLRMAELFCDDMYARATIRALTRAQSGDFVVIGGGGLLHEHFRAFWSGFEPVSRRMPFCVWGVGACEMHHEPTSLNLVRRILARSKLTVVRDSATHRALDLEGIREPVPCPTMTVLQAAGERCGGVLNAVHKGLVPADVRESIATIAKDFARCSGRTYRETTNTIPGGDESALAANLALYRSADVVVSSRLHGCIIGVGMGCSTLAIGSDAKIDQFMHAAGLAEWVCPLTDIASLRQRLDSIAMQQPARAFVDRVRRQNQAIAGELRVIFEQLGTHISPDPMEMAEASSANWNDRWIDQVVEQLNAVIPSNQKFNLIDEQLLSSKHKVIAATALPFPEIDGEYWGPPADSTEAIAALERSRERGAGFIVFVAPAFWWLGHYVALDQYLRTGFRCVLDTEELVVFDLRDASSAKPEHHAAHGPSRVPATPVQPQDNFARWSSLSNFHVDWDERTELIARLVPPRSRVIEFGAGRRQLELFLDPSCAYFPSDLVDRGPGTIVFDLNARPLPDFRELKLDVAVFSGVLEYVTDLLATAQWLARQVSICVASYACANSESGTTHRIQEISARARHGWVNTCTEAEFARIFVDAGFNCRSRDAWGNQRIFVFQNPGHIVGGQT